MFKIGDFSKLTSVSIRMLRYYNEVGLFEPGMIDDFTGYRYYSTKQIPKLNRIIALRNMGFNVSEISNILNEESEVKVKEILLHKQESVTYDIQKEKEKLRLIASAIEDFTKESKNMKYNVELKSVPEFRVLALRDTVPTYNDEGILWHRMTEFAQSKSLPCSGICFAQYFDEGYKEKDVDIEIVMEVDKEGCDEQGFVFKKTQPITLAASVLVPGDFSNIAPAFQFLGQWVEEHGYGLDGNSRQIPIKGPWNESDPNNYLNEIQIPVKKSSL